MKASIESLIVKCVLLVCLCVVNGCGLDGVSGRLIKIDGGSYVLKAGNGKEMILHVNHVTRKDDVAPGDAVHAYVSKDGHAHYLQRLE